MQTRLLLIGIGNSSRGDDALGWKIADEAARVPFLQVEYRYQLQIEDADLIKDFDVVIFADSSHEDFPDGFTFLSVRPECNIAFSSHRLSPSAVLALCQEIYGWQPEAYMLAVTGKKWELGMSISQSATAALRNANRFLKTCLMNGESKKKALRLEGLTN